MKRIIGIIELSICTFIWGLAFVFQSIASDYLKAFSITGIRFFMGGIFLLIIIIIRATITKKRYINKTTLKYGIIIGLVLIIASSLQQAGIANTSTANAGFLTAMYIIFVPVISLIIYKKKINKFQLIAILFSLLGVALLTLSKDYSVNPADGLCLLSALFYAIHIILCGYGTKKCDTISMAMISFFVTGIIALIIGLIFERPISTSDVSSALPSLLFLGIGSCGIAYTLQMLGQKDVEEIPATLIMSLEAVISAIFGFIILNEGLGGQRIAGCIIMFLATVSIQLLKNGKEKNQDE